MSVDFNHETVMNMFENKRKKFLIMTGMQGANLASINTHPHIDTGASVNAKQFTFEDPNKITPFKDLGDVKKIQGTATNKNDTVYILAPMEYDVYLERRYGVMAKTEQQLIPYMARYEEEIF